MCPAVGQGALAIETRAAAPGFDACAALDHARHARRRHRRTRRAGRAGRRLPGAHRRARHGGRRPPARCWPWWPRPTARELVRGRAEGASPDDAERIGRDARAQALLAARRAPRILESRVRLMTGQDEQSLSGRRRARAIRNCITCKGRRMLEQADAVLYDHLATRRAARSGPRRRPSASTSARRNPCTPSPRKRSAPC